MYFQKVITDHYAWNQNHLALLGNSSRWNCRLLPTLPLAHAKKKPVAPYSSRAEPCYLRVALIATSNRRRPYLRGLWRRLHLRCHSLALDSRWHKTHNMGSLRIVCGAYWHVNHHVCAKKCITGNPTNGRYAIKPSSAGYFLVKQLLSFLLHFWEPTELFWLNNPQRIIRKSSGRLKSKHPCPLLNTPSRLAQSVAGQRINKPSLAARHTRPCECRLDSPGIDQACSTPKLGTWPTSALSGNSSGCFECRRSVVVFGIAGHAH